MVSIKNVFVLFLLIIGGVASPLHAASKSDSLFAQGQEALQAGQSEIAAQAFRKTLDVDSEYLPAYLELAKIYEERTWYRDAAELYQQALTLKPNSVKIINRLAMALVQQGNTAEALDMFLTAEKIDPIHPVTQFGVGKLMIALENFGDAAQRFTRAIQLLDAPDTIEKLETSDLDSLRAHYYFNLGLAHKFHAQEADSTGRPALKVPRQNKALDAFADAIAYHPEGTETYRYYFERAQVLDAQGRAEEAIIHYEAVIALSGAGSWETEYQARRRLKVLRK